MRGMSASPARKRSRHLLACVAVVLLGAVAATGCGAEPDSRNNALVVHVVAPDCDSRSVPALLVAGEHPPTTIMRPLRRVDGCGEPLDGPSRDGEVLQVWESDPEWERKQSFRVQVGRRSDAVSWFIGTSELMRIDHSHLFLGTIDLVAAEERFVEPRRTDAVTDRLEDRQGCDGIGWTSLTIFFRSCGTEWEHADLFTLEPA